MAVLRLLGVLWLSAGALLGFALPSAAEEPERYNCPEGFVWVRMSGTGCVQEELPPNGRTGYDGHPICNEAFVGIYEQRRTTDGKGVPGNPASSFAYLLECVAPQEFAARQSQVQGAATLGDAASRLAADGMQLPPGELVLLGALGSGALIFAALPTIRRRDEVVPSTGAGEAREPSVDASPSEAGPAAEPPLDADELRQRISRLEQIDQDLAARMDHYRQEAAAGRLTPQDVVAWTGIVADLVGVVPAAQLPAGILSIAANLAGMVGEQYDTRDLDRAIRAGLGAMAQLRGTISAELEGYQASLADAEQPRETPVPPVAPELLGDDALRAERDRTHQQVLEAGQRRTESVDTWITKRNALREQQRRIEFLVDHLPDLDAPPTQEDASAANTWLNLAAGLDSFARSHQREVAAAGALEASDLVMRLFRGQAQGTFADALNRATDLGGEARFAQRAGNVTNAVSVGTAAMSMYEWFHARSAEEQRAIVERAIEGMRYDSGRLDVQVRQAEAAMGRAEAESDALVARRRALSTALEMRGNVLWRS